MNKKNVFHQEHNYREEGMKAITILLAMFTIAFIFYNVYNVI
jgi:hypothetical protein